MLVPLYGFMQGDTLGLIVLVHEQQTVRDIALCLQEAASIRVPVSQNARVYFNGEELDPATTVAAAGLSALDRVDVIPEDD